MARLPFRVPASSRFGLSVAVSLFLLHFSVFHPLVVRLSFPLSLGRLGESKTAVVKMEIPAQRQGTVSIRKIKL